MAQQFILQIENEHVLIVANPQAEVNIKIYIIVGYFNVINSSA